MKYQFGPRWPIFGSIKSPLEKLHSFEIVNSKTIISPQISLYYWFSSFFHHWYMKYKFELFLTQFWFNEVTRRVKTAVFWESNLRNIFLTSKFDQILISIFLSPLIFLLASKPKAFMLSNHACKTEPCHQTITLNRF